MEHFTDIGQSIEEGLARQKRELQEAGFIPDISSAGHFTLKDRSGQTVLEGELINKQLVFSQLQVTEDIKELAKDYFISTIAQEHIVKENGVQESESERAQSNQLNNESPLRSLSGDSDTSNIPQNEEKSSGKANDSFKGTNVEKAVEKYASESILKSARKRVNIDTFCSKDTNKYLINGVYYDEGKKVATNGKYLLVEDAEYPESYEGKIIADKKHKAALEKGYEKKKAEYEKKLAAAKVSGEGTMEYIEARKSDPGEPFVNENGEVKGPYPNYKNVIPDTSSKNYSDITDDFNTNIDKIEKLAYMGKKLEGITKEPTRIKIFGTYFDSSQISDILCVAKNKGGLTGVHFFDAPQQAPEVAVFEGKGFKVVVMPMRYEYGDNYLDVASGNYEGNQSDEVKDFLKGDADREQRERKEKKIVEENEKIIEEGLENMQVNGGMSNAAMEADYEYEQFPAPEMEETEEESFGFENFTAEALLHLAEISPEAYESLKKEYEQRTGLSADEYLKKAGDKDRQEKKESLISQRLKSLLEAQEMTIQELSIKARVTEAAMLRYINGERIPRGAILLNVANAFGVSVEQITGKEFPFTVGEEIPLDTFASSYGGENWIIEKINENNVQLGRSTDNIVIQHEGKVMSKEDFLEAVQAIHPELVNTVVEKNPPEQKPDIATSFVLEKLKSVGIEVITDKNEFEKILHKETLLQKSMKQLSSDEINAYFSFNKDDIERFNKSLDDWEKNKMNPFRLIQVGKIPPVMKALGIADEPVEIQSSTIMKILRPEPRYTYESQGHNLTMDDVRAIPKLLADPVMVFTSRTREDSYVFFTERKDSENRSIIIPIAVNKRKGRIIINEITSMYGRNNEFEFVHSSIESGNLVYMDKKRTEEWEKKISSAGSRAFRKQYPGERATKLTEPSISILTKERLVNFISSRQLMISDGTTYGFAYNGKIYLNPDFLNSNVAVHEYTHLWDKYIQNTNPELWERGKEAFKKTSLWEQVKNDPSYTEIAGDDNLILSECHARICGEIAQSVLEKIAQEDGQIAKDAVIDWDKETWTYIAQNFTQDIASFIEVKDFMNLPIKDLMNEKIISYEQVTPAKENDKNASDTLEAEKQLLSQFMPPEQLFATLDLLAGEEGSFFAGKIKEIATAIEKAPKIYETDGMKEHPVILRYFHPTGTETLVCEIGTNGEAFGYQVINSDWVNSEFGYLNIDEIKNIPGMEIDFHFPENMSIERWLYTQSPEHFREYADLFEQPTQESPMQAPTQETVTPINMNELHNTMVLNGNTYPVVEIEASLEKDLQEIFKTFIPEPYIGGVKIYHNPEEPGKINLLVQYGTDKIEGEWTEEALSNDLKREHITFNGIEVNVKAISPDRTGTIDEYLAMLEENNIMIEHEGQLNQTSGVDIASDNLDTKKPETIGDIDVETLRKALQTALEETAEELPYTPFTRENYNTLFPYSKVETPLGAVKLGAHQFEKLEQKDRQYILQAVHDTLADPSIVIKETGKDVFGEDKISNIFAKSYIFPSDKVRGIQSVVVSIDGENISITSHQRDISNVVNKIKKPDQLLFAAARVRLLVERMDKPVTVNPTSEFGYAESLSDSIREDLQKVNKYDTQFFSQSFNLEGKTSTEKVKEITEKLKTGVNEIFESGQYEQYLKVMSKFHDYSTNNTILIALQRPDATRVAGFTTWKNEFQRSVKKGEKGIKILAPMFFKKEPQEKDVTDSETHSSENHEQEENEEQIITRFKVVNVFDICQTEGKELPRLGVDALKGDVEHYEAFYHSLEKTSPVPMAFEAIKDASHGYYDLVDKRIAIKAGLSQLQTIKTAIHEIAHATLHADKNSNTDRSTAEVQAESIAYTVCSYYGLDTSDYSFGYVAGWSRGKEIKELKDSLEIIRKTSSQIITDIDKHFSQIQEKQVIKEKQKTAFAQLELFSREELSNTPSIRKLMIDQALNREHITAGKAALRKYSESVLSGKQEGLWKSFYQFKTKGVFDIVGSKITLNKEGTLPDTSWNQLHTALKIYRDKRFETFRYLFVDNKGMIKDQLTLCSYLPNRTVATLPGKNIIPNIIKHAEETQTRIILAHNHPSGSTSPSFEDVLTTQKLKRIFTNSKGKSLLLGHIILDHDTAEIYDNSKANWYTIQTNKTNKDPLTKNDPLAKTELYSSLLLNSVCRQINETDTWKAKGFVPLVFVSGDKKVSAIKMYPESFFAGSQEDVLKELQHIGSQTGSNWCFPIVQNRKDISQNCTKNIRRLFEKKCFMDYMIEKEIGTELNSSYGGGIFDAISAEERQKRIKIESTFYLDKNNNTIATNTGVLICNEENEVKENTLPEKLFTTKEIKSGQSHTGILKESYLVSQNFFPPMTEKDGTISIYCSSKDLNMPVYALNPNEPVKVNMTKKQVAVLLDTAIKTHILKVKNTKDFKITLPEKSNPNPDFAKMLMSVTPGISYEGIKKEYNKIFNSVSKEMNALRIQACKSQSPSRPLPQKRVYSGGMEY